MIGYEHLEQAYIHVVGFTFKLTGEDTEKKRAHQLIHSKNSKKSK